ncbi:MAG: hypothetical protein VX777_05925 [Chlamydiota bacterium]|nr:hypothetical protein [Chlamydiota bacterium]
MSSIRGVPAGNPNDEINHNRAPTKEKNIFREPKSTDLPRKILKNKYCNADVLSDVSKRVLLNLGKKLGGSPILMLKINQIFDLEASAPILYESLKQVQSRVHKDE